MELNKKEVGSLGTKENGNITTRIYDGLNLDSFYLFHAFVSNFRYVSKPLYDVLRKLDLVWQNAYCKTRSVEFADKMVAFEIDKLDIIWI